MKLLLLLVSFVFITAGFGQKLKPTSTNDFVMECMKVNGEGANKQMVLWLPYNFWEIVGEQMKVTPEFVENIVNQLKNYTLFCVVDYTTTSTGLIFKTEEQMRKTFKLTDSSGNVLAPLEEKDISEDVKHLLKNLEPITAQMLGQFGEGMKIFLFKATKSQGQPVIDVSTKNTFTLSWDKCSLTWKLPFASVLPPKRCPVDNETMKGNWNYCPEHGVKLN